MAGIRSDSWQIKWFDAVEPTDGSERYYSIAFRNDGTNWRDYWLIWEPETGFLEGRVRREPGLHKVPLGQTVKSLILPYKMTLAMAHRAGIIPEGALNTKTHRPEFWAPRIKHITLETTYERPQDGGAHPPRQDDADRGDGGGPL